MSTVDTHQEHLDRLEYCCAVQTLHDARRVIADLRDLAASQTVVAASDIEFLSRRAEQLVEACITAHEETP